MSKSILILILILILGAFHSPNLYAEKPGILPLAWWLDIEFELKCDSRFDSYFTNEKGCYTLLTRDSLAKKSPEYLKDLDSLGFVLNTKNDISGNGTFEFLGVGIYSNENGTGRFLVVSENAEYTKILRVFREEGAKGFSALKIDKKNTYWFFCMECSNYENLIEKNNHYYLD
jgi:hypothetical protein